MPEYIEKDAFLRMFCPRNPEAFENPAYAAGWNILFRIVKEFPVANVAPVVRCKDCIHCDFGGWGLAICRKRSKEHLFTVHQDEFCNFGERRNDNV